MNKLQTLKQFIEDVTKMVMVDNFTGRFFVDMSEGRIIQMEKPEKKKYK